MRHWPPALQAVLSENSGRLGVHLHWCVGNIIVQALHQRIVQEFKEQIHHIMDTQCFFSIQNQSKWFFCGCFMLFLNPPRKRMVTSLRPFVLSFSASVGAFGEGLRKPHQVDPSTRPETLGNWKWFVNARTPLQLRKRRMPGRSFGVLFRDCELQARHRPFFGCKNNVWVTGSYPLQKQPMKHVNSVPGDSPQAELGMVWHSIWLPLLQRRRKTHFS